MILYNENGEKRCSKCKEFKPVDEFIKRLKASDGLLSWCKICHSESKKTPEAKATSKKQKFRYYYGLIAGTEEFETLFKQKEKGCQICGKTNQAVRNGKVRDLVVDHCHKTGKVRGLLCYKCNYGLGLFDDDIEVMKKAIKYLRK